MAEDKNGTTLAEIVSQSAAITRALIEAGGELSPQLEADIGNLDLAVAKKIDAYNAVAERLERESDYWAAKAKESDRIAKACSRAAEVLWSRMKAGMIAMDRTELEGEEIRLKLQLTAGRLTIAEADLPASWLIEKVSYEPDKERIKAALQAGQEIAGAKIEKGLSLRVYANRKGK